MKIFENQCNKTHFGPVHRSGLNCKTSLGSLRERNANRRGLRHTTIVFSSFENSKGGARTTLSWLLMGDPSLCVRAQLQPSQSSYRVGSRLRFAPRNHPCTPKKDKRKQNVVATSPHRGQVATSRYAGHPAATDRAQKTAADSNPNLEGARYLDLVVGAWYKRSTTW